jgi:transposase
MMGQRGGNQDRLFYSFNLDDHVPADHLLRGIDRFLDLADLRQHLASYYSHTGRPSVDPELMIRMLLVGYCFGIRSERRLCDIVKPEPKKRQTKSETKKSHQIQSIPSRSQSKKAI